MGSYDSVSYMRAGVADCDHARRNLRRLFVAAARPPARVPARSDVSAYKEPVSSSGGVSMRSRINAATLRPVDLASA